MDMFVRDAELAQWETALTGVAGPADTARLPHLAALAWHLRQRDPARARLLSTEIMALLPALAADEALLLRGRLLLVAAEGAWVGGELDAAQYQAEQALQLYSEVEQHHQAAARGRADASWVQAWVANDRGDSIAADRWLAQAAAAAQAAADPVRIDVMAAAAGICAAFTDGPTAQQQWRQRFDPDLDGVAPIAAGWISDFFGTCAFQHSEYGRAIGHLMRSYDTARTSGQLRRAIIIATNIGNAFTCLNAHEAALEWMQRGQDLARPTGWPLSIGMCLMQTAENNTLLCALASRGPIKPAGTILRRFSCDRRRLPSSRRLISNKIGRASCRERV